MTAPEPPPLDGPLIRPLHGYVVAAEHAAEVCAPAYDALSPDERAAHVAANPRSFLSVLPEAEYTDAARLTAAASRLDDLIAGGVFVRQPAPFLLVYRLHDGAHTQTGIVGDLPVTAIRSGHVRAHEYTRPDREAQIVRFLDAVGVASSPVCLAYRAEPTVDGLVADATTGPPRVALTTDDGLRQELWVIDDPGQIERLQGALAGIGDLYITDGHHRSAAALRFAEAVGADATDPAAQLLVVLFPHDQLRVIDYDRVVYGLAGHTPSGLRAVLSSQGFETRALDGPARPSGRGSFTLALADGWSEVAIPPGVRAGGPVAQLDVSILHDEVIGPMLGIEDARSDPRLHYVPGIHGPQVLSALVRRDGAGFVPHPPSVAELMAVADAGQVMPPKSTYFAPKVRSGLVLRFRTGPLA